MTAASDDMAAAAALIRGDEGVRLRVYDDATGLPVATGSTLRGDPTIGWGRDLASRGISASEAEVMFGNDLAAAMLAARSFVGPAAWAGLVPARRAVLADMAFNLGAAGLGHFVRLRAAVLAGEDDDAADEIVSSRLAPERAHRLAEIWRTGRLPPGFGGDDVS